MMARPNPSGARVTAILFFFIIVVKMLFSLEFGTPDMYGRSVGPDIFLVVR